MKKPARDPAAACEFCAYYDYDDELGCYSCQMNLDEDEMYAFLKGRRRDCPYFRFSDDYKLAHRQ